MAEQSGRGEPHFGEVAPGELRRRTAQGALVATGMQGIGFALRVGSLMILARLLLKEDFGLVSMVTAFTGFLAVFRDAGLSMVTVQRESITTAQTSALFWISVALGSLLGVMTALGAPLIVAFYGEPRLFWVTVALGMTFVFNGVSVQHRAILQRNLHISGLAVVDIASLLLSIAVGVAMAWAGGGYWSLVVMTLAQPAIGAVGVWLATRWIPGRPRRQSGVRAMMGYGGAVTLNNVTMYLAYNADKALLGRFFGAEALGVYSRAYQLINISTENLNATMGSVAFPALSRLQGDAARQRSYFLMGYKLLLSLAIPITAICALFADDIVVIFLGSRWQEAGSVLRLLAPTVVAFGLINPFGWLMYASGLARRSLMIAFMIAPVVMLGYAAGLSYGPQGVALGYSLAMLLLIVPVIAWSRRGMPITTRDVLRAVGPIFCAAAVGAGAVVGVGGWLARLEPVIVRLAVEASLFCGVYFAVLLFVMNEKSAYVQVFRETGIWPLKGFAARLG